MGRGSHLDSCPRTLAPCGAQPAGGPSSPLGPRRGWTGPTEGLDRVHGGAGPTEGLDRAVSVRLAQCSLGSWGRPGAAQCKHRTPLAVFQFHPTGHPQHFLQGSTSSLLLPQAFCFTEAPGRWAVFVAFVLSGPMSLEVLRPQGPSQARTEGSPCPLTPWELQQGPPRRTPSRVPWASARPWPPQGGPAGENKAAPWRCNWRSTYSQNL